MRLDRVVTRGAMWRCGCDAWCNVVVGWCGGWVVGWWRGGVAVLAVLAVLAAWWCGGAGGAGGVGGVFARRM